jgi:hypothetical protein
MCDAFCHAVDLNLPYMHTSYAGGVLHLCLHLTLHAHQLCRGCSTPVLAPYLTCTPVMQGVFYTCACTLPYMHTSCLEHISTDPKGANLYMKNTAWLIEAPATRSWSHVLVHRGRINEVLCSDVLSLDRSHNLSTINHKCTMSRPLGLLEVHKLKTDFSGHAIVWQIVIYVLSVQR